MTHPAAKHAAQAQENKPGHRRKQNNVQELKTVVHNDIFKLGLVKLPTPLM